jgi:hypothetical protein
MAKDLTASVASEPRENVREESGRAWISRV